MTIGVVVLAAGQGTRMRSALPKVLHPLAGRPLIHWVLDALDAAEAAATVVVVGHGAEAVGAALPAGVDTAVQPERRGTGDAAAIGIAGLPPECDTVLVACGDTPLLSREAVADLVAAHRAAGTTGTVLTAVADDAGSYGRIVRDEVGLVAAIVEARDADEAQLSIGEFNAGLYVYDRASLEDALAGLGTENAQGELYLTDAVASGGSLGALVAASIEVAAGVNDRVDLAACESVVQDRLRHAAMLAGVSMPDPSAVYLDAQVTYDPDAVLWPGVHLRGACHVGEGAQVGPDVVAEDTRLGAGCVVRAAHLVGADVGDGCSVGPFAYLRPGARLEAGAKAGTYVELKNATLGRGAKVPHLSYIGDATVGEGSNIGAGNITANYDGFRKHRTRVGARVRTGSDCVLVAPVTIGDDAMTGAGSILTDDVPPGALGIARARQTNIEGFTEKAAARARAASEAEQAGGTTE
ncbi:MAG: bifunctional UDP-N-acetylglucosamine diphosphorylase/glucosamine-1-phosphate N-acetyltransferase GlmU [Miltoncostaeaceae bacterium]